MIKKFLIMKIMILFISVSLCLQGEWTEFSAILAPSPIEGIGVFATHDIEAGTPVMTGKCRNLKVPEEEIPFEFLKYCTDLHTGECLRPTRFDRIEIDWFLNHSFEPNVGVDSDDNYFAIRDIKAGEELLIDYNYLEEPEEEKDSFYKN